MGLQQAPYSVAATPAQVYAELDGLYSSLHTGTACRNSAGRGGLQSSLNGYTARCLPVSPAGGCTIRGADTAVAQVPHQHGG